MVCGCAASVRTSRAGQARSADEHVNSPDGAAVLPGRPMMAQRLVAVAALTAVAAAGWAAYLAVPPAISPAASGTVLETDTIGGVTVLTNTAGFTLYWFAPDTATRSNCDASCARRWPPVTGLVTAGRGVTGAIGTITRSGGSVQATYDGHPLYTASADTAPGQAKGNGLYSGGGIWHEMTVSDATPPARPPAIAAAARVTDGLAQGRSHAVMTDQAAYGVGNPDRHAAQGQLAQAGPHHRPAGEPADDHPPGEQGDRGDTQRRGQDVQAEQVRQERDQRAQ
jgi:predicted lipoprotein with Yx(FWY)xxD motif